nr:MAG TPA: crystallin beta/gamma motif-containing protein [Caudoviricetes sp.]
MADTNDIQKRRAALLTSFGVNPDEVAEINRKAAGLNVPAGVVKAMPETANSRLKLNQIEAQIGGLSILPQRLSDPEFSDIAHDDISQLSEIERKRGVMTAGREDNFFVDLYRSVARGWYTGKKNLNGLIARSDFFGLEKQREAAAKANGTYYNRNLDIAQQQAELQRDIDRYAPDATLQRQQRELGSQKTLSGSASYLVRNPSLLLNTTAESLGQNALGLVAGAATGGWAAVGTVGLSSGAQEYSATMEEVLEKHAGELGGMTPTERYAYALSREDWMEEARSKAWKRGISVGAFDAATAGVAGRLLGGATGKLSAAARTAGEAGIQAGGGAAGEAVAQAATGEYNPSAIIMEAFAEIPTGAFEARSNYKEARAQMESRQAQVKAAEEARAHLKEQAMAVTRSRMTQRDPDKQAAFVNDVYGEDQKIYFDGGALMQSGRAAAVAQAMPDMAAKIQEAAETGGMVEMTRGDFHARLTQEDQNALAEIAMETPDSMTAAEAEEIRKSGFDAMMDEAYQADLARHQEEQAQVEQDRRVAEFEAFKEEAKAQLTAAGTMDANQAEANATLYARAVETLAGRLNMGIRDFDAAYGGLNVVGESLIDDGVLNQALASNPPRGWVHSENPQDAADLWNGNNKAEAVFWTNGNPRLAGEFPALEGYSHSVSKADINHIKKEHGDAQAEAARGQIAITDKDIARIPDIVSDYGAIRDDLVSEQGSKRIMFAKSFDDGTVVYLGQVSRKKKDIKTVSMWKYPSAIDEQRAIEIAVTSNQTFGTEAGISHKETVSDNSTPNTDANQDILYQGGADRGMFSREHNLIALLKNADASTFVHELGHFFLETNTRIARDLTAKPAENLTGQERQFLSDIQTTLDWFGVKDLAAWDAMSLNEQRENHEKWARGFEAYLYEGKAPSEELRGVFRRFRSWLKQVYQSLKSLNVELTDEVRSVFDRMFASDEQIQQTQYINGMTPMFEDAAQAGMDDTDYAQYRHNTERATAEAQDDLTARALRDMAFIRNLRARKIREMRKQHKADFQRAEMAARGSIMSQPVYRAWQLLTARMTEENRIGDGKPKFSKQVDAAHDSLFEAIAKLGGVNKDEMIRQFGLDPKDKIPAVHIGYPVLRKTNGRSIDGMIEALTEEGYLPVDDTGKADPRDFEERFFDEMRGTKRYSSAHVPHEQKAGDHVANPYALTAVRFDHDSLVEMGVDGQTLERLIDFDMTRKNGGMHPDLVSDLILNEDGEPVFTGGEDLIRALTEAQPPQEAIEETAYLNVLAEKGEVPTQADFEEAADLAAHSEIRQRIIAAEFKALSKATGAANLIRKAASVYAQEKVEQIKVRDLRPSVYTRAEAKAAKASQDAFRKGDIPTAATQKRNQLLQNSMAREVLKAREEMEKARKYLGKFNRVVKSIDIEYREQIEALLESVELSNAPSLKDLDRRTSLLQFIKKMEEQGRAHNIDAEYIAEIQAKRNYREMTVEEMRVLVDTVKGIEHLGRLKNKMLTARDKRTYQEIRDKIVESIRDNARDHDKRTSTAANNIERVEDGFSGFMWGHIKISSIARILDGGKDAGAFWNYFIRPINEAADREATMTAETAQKLEEILKPLNDNLTHREYWRNAEYQIGGQKFTRRQLFAIALNLGNEGNIQRLLSGGHGSVRNWNMPEVMDAMQHLTSKEWEAVQKVWDLFESFRPQIAELERKVVGIEPQWVEAKPLTVRTADGEMLTLRGGYYPAKYDPASTQAAESGNALSDIEDIKSAVKMAANTRHSFTKDRAAAVENRPLLLDLSVTYNGLNEIIHDLTHREAVIDAARLLKSSSIDKAIRETLGAQAKRQLNKALEDIARGNTAPVEGLDKYSGLLRQNVSMTGLGFNVVSAAVQLTGFIPAVARLGGKYAWAGLSQYTTHPIKATKAAMEQSEFMRNRGNTRLREIREVAATINGAGKIRKFLNKYSYWLMMKMQQVVDTAIWHGALAKAMDSGKDLDTAIKLADQTVLDTQGGGQIKDLSEFERGSNTHKLFTVFYAYMNTALNQGFVEAKTQKSKAKLAADLMMIYVVPTALTALMKSALIPGDDDDDLAKKLAKEQISFLLGLFVFGREMTQLANIATGDRFYGYTGPSGLRPFDDAFKFVQQAIQGEFDSAFVRTSVNLLGDAFGLPSAQINRTIKGAQALQDDETDNPAALLFGHQGN